MRRLVSSKAEFLGMVSAPPVQLTSPPEPSEEECDRILGAYLRAWNQIEISLAALLSHLADSNTTTGYILSQAISDWRTRREIIEALGNARLKKADQAQLLDLMEQVQRANTKRNRLVHGSWTLLINIHRDQHGTKRAVTGKWIRADWPSDLGKMDEIRSNPKIRKQHEYNTQTIVNLTGSARKLARAVDAFTKATSLVPFVPPTPLDIS